MARREADVSEVEEQLAEAQAQIEALQSAAADAAARAATLEEKLSQAEAEFARAASASEAELSEARSQLREAAGKYREARLASAPDVPQDLVPLAESLAEIDEGFEAAQRVVSRLRERMQEERQAARVPVGSPARRAADLSGLSATEKIKLGLQQLSEREGR